MGRGNARQWRLWLKKEDEGRNCKHTKSCKNIRKDLVCYSNFHLELGTSYSKKPSFIILNWHIAMHKVCFNRKVLFKIRVPF